MHSILFAFAATGLVTVATAFTPLGENTWAPLLTPDLTNPVTQGEEFTVTWDPEGFETDGVTVSLVLCHGPSTNCVPFDEAIVEGVPAAQKSYDWAVPLDLEPGKQNTDTGYGMMVIVDGTGEFQYSTQFSVLEAEGGSSSGPSSSTTSKPFSSTTTIKSTSILLGPPAQQTGSWSTSYTGTATKSGWGSTYATETASATGTYTSLPGATLTDAATTIPASDSTSTSSAPGTSFTGAADRLSLNAAGVVVAGFVAMFAL